MKQILDLNGWARTAHFHFFKQFDEPFFGVTVNIDCTLAYAAAKAKGVSFFLYYLHKSLSAANQTPAFRYRIVEDQVWVYDQVDASTTVDRPDGTFGFSYIEFEEDFQAFKTGGRSRNNSSAKQRRTFSCKIGRVCDSLFCTSMDQFQFHVACKKFLISRQQSENIIWKNNGTGWKEKHAGIDPCTPCIDGWPSCRSIY